MDEGNQTPRKFSIPSNSANQGGVMWKVFEQLSVGKTSVDDHPHRRQDR
jgi:hypothetical protein